MAPPGNASAVLAACLQEDEASASGCEVCGFVNCDPITTLSPQPGLFRESSLLAETYIHVQPL